jgi:phosphotriesterase-related protein
MTRVHTVRGPIDTADLGRVLMHEHVFVLGTEIRQNYPNFPTPWDEETRVADAVAKLAACKSRGIDTIVDPTVLGLGRYIPRIQRINAQVDINIIAATGIYTYNDIPFQFQRGLIFDRPDALTELFVQDIREGIADTGVKAAFLKCAIEKQGLMPGVEIAMRAVGQAHVETGAPITVHTNPHTGSGLVAQKVLAEEGADLTKVVIGHCGDSTDLHYHARSPTPAPIWAWTASAWTCCARSRTG